MCGHSNGVWTHADLCRVMANRNNLTLNHTDQTSHWVWPNRPTLALKHIDSLALAQPTLTLTLTLTDLDLYSPWTTMALTLTDARSLCLILAAQWPIAPTHTNLDPDPHWPWASLTLLDDVRHVLAQFVREEPDDGEDDEPSENGRADVTDRDDHSVPAITQVTFRH